MIKKIRGCLSDIKDPDLKEHYSQLIFTLLEKGYFPGLAGVPVAKSGISHIDGEKGILTYRGYPVQELAEHCSYEDVAFLLLNGDLPLRDEKDVLQKQFLVHNNIDRDIAKAVIAMPVNLHPMYMLSASVLQLQANDNTCFTVDNYNQNLLRAIRLIAKLPTFIGISRTRDVDFSADKEFTSYAEYCLYCFNQDLADDEEWVDIFEKILILHADHTMNNSTFSVRAVASSKASIYASVASAINSLSGPLHGGANERVLKMLQEIGSPDKVESYIGSVLAKGEKIMGIGHRVYKTYDPRALFMKNKILPRIFAEDSPLEIDTELRDLYKTAQKMERVVLDVLSGKRLYPNVDFWSGLVMKALGIEPHYFTTVFVLGRIMGWSAHWVEHMEVKNRIFRPNQLYDGFNDRHILVEPEEEIASTD